MSRTEDLLEIARKHLIRFHAANEEPPVLSRGLGTKVWDVEGKEYLDLMSGQVCATIGHNHPRIVEALREAADKKIHCNDFLLSDDSIMLAAEMAKIMPPSLSKYIFKSTGSEANETAFYMAKIFTGKYEVVSPDRSFYGNTAAARASSYRSSHRGHGPNMPGTYVIPAPYCYRCPLKLTSPECGFACADVGFAMFDRESDGSAAVVVSEPIMSGGGVIDPPAGYLKHLQKKAQERGMLLMLDEAQTGLGRCGTMFTFEQDDIVPDILTMSKTLGGGIPLSAVATTDEIEEVCFKRKFIMGSSHTNDPLPTRVGAAVLRVLREERLPERARENGAYFKARLKELAETFEIIGDVRGRGLLIGIELVSDRVLKTPADRAGKLFGDACTEMGLIVGVINNAGENTVVRLGPPLTISRSEIDQALDIMRRAFAQVTNKIGATLTAVGGARPH